MAPSDRDALIGMGYPANRVDRALRATRGAGLVPALDWLEQHQDDPDIDEPISGSSGNTLGSTVGSSSSSSSAAVAAAATAEGSGQSSTAGGEGEGDDNEEREGDVIQEGDQTPQSLVCQDCGMILRNADAAQRHALRTEHVNFAESTTVIQPLTEEERKAKLAELKERLAQKRAARAQADIADKKTAELIRRRAGQDLSAVKAQMEEREMQKALARKKKEKEDEAAAKRKIKEQIEADRQERIRKKQQAQAGTSAAAAAASTPPPPAAAASSSSSSSAPAPAKVYTEAKLQFRQPDRPQMLHHTFQATDTLSVVYEFVSGQRGGETAFRLMTTFPRKILDGEDRNKTLAELQLVPSATLVITGN